MLWHEQLRRLAKLAVTGGLYHSGELGNVHRKQMRERSLLPDSWDSDLQWQR